MDETQGSGRAIVLEEGLAAFVFSHAKTLAFFEDQTSLSFDPLKTVRQFVEGYEVDACPLKQRCPSRLSLARGASRAVDGANASDQTTANGIVLLSPRANRSLPRGPLGPAHGSPGLPRERGSHAPAPMPAKVRAHAVAGQ